MAGREKVSAGAYFLAGFTALVLVGGGVGAGWTWFSDTREGLASQSWPSVQSEISESRTGGTRGQREAVIAYMYRVDDRWYESRRTGYFDRMFGTSSPGSGGSGGA